MAERGWAPKRGERVQRVTTGEIGIVTGMSEMVRVVWDTGATSSVDPVSLGPLTVRARRRQLGGVTGVIAGVKLERATVARRAALEQPSGVVSARELVRRIDMIANRDDGAAERVVATELAAAYERGKREGAEPWELLWAHANQNDQTELEFRLVGFPETVQCFAPNGPEDAEGATYTEAARALCVKLGLKGEGK